MQRTLILHLHPPAEQARILKATLEQHTACYNAVAREGFTTGCSNSTELHKRTYYPLRAEYPNLPSQLVCAARVKASESVRSALTWKRKHETAHARKVAQAEKQGKHIPHFKPARCPISASCSIRYDQRSYWVKWEASTCSLSTIAGRLELPFTVPEHLKKYVGNKPCSADLCLRNGRLTLHLVVSLALPAIEPCNEVVGGDLGLSRPAVTSTRHFLGQRRWKDQDRRTFRLKRTLQKCGSKSARRHLRRLSGKQLRRRKDHDHVLSKRLVQQPPPGATIVLENLKHIRATSRIGRGKHNTNVDTKRRLHSWSFAQLTSFAEYKAQARGIRVVAVDPRHTSQTCSRCGIQDGSSRRSQSIFHCRTCGYQLNADLNAAVNIREKYMASLARPGTSLTGGSQSIGPSFPPSGEEQAPLL